MPEVKVSYSEGALNIGRLRPYLGDDNKIYVYSYMGGPVNKKSSYREVCINHFPLTTNATLRRDEWKQLDERLMLIARERLGGWQDLLDNGLTYDLGNAMGTTVLEWHDMSDNLTVDMTMDGITRGKNDQPKFQTNYLPLPILHVDYEINTRHLEASRKLGNPLDTTLAEMAVRRIIERQEDMLFTTTYEYAFGTKDDRDRNKIYSYLGFPDRNTVNLSIPWNHSAITPALILQDVLEMKQASINAYHYGPWMMYIPTAFETVHDDDYDTQTPGTTIRERILKIAGIKGIKVIDHLATDNVLLVEMKPETVRIINGFGITNVADKEEFGMVSKYKVMAIQIPQIRSDQNGKCGIVHLA